MTLLHPRCTWKAYKISTPWQALVETSLALTSLMIVYFLMTSIQVPSPQTPPVNPTWSSILTPSPRHSSSMFVLRLVPVDVIVVRRPLRRIAMLHNVSLLQTWTYMTLHLYLRLIPWMLICTNYMHLMFTSMNSRAIAPASIPTFVLVTRPVASLRCVLTWMTVLR